MKSKKHAVDDESDTSMPHKRMHTARHINPSTSTAGSSWYSKESRTASCNAISKPKKTSRTDKKSSTLRELESFNAQPLTQPTASKDGEAKKRRAEIFAHLREVRTPVASAAEHMQERQNTQKRKKSSLLQEIEDYNSPPKPTSVSNLVSIPTSNQMRGPSRQSAINAGTRIKRQIKADLTADCDLQGSDTRHGPRQKR